jgi:RNA polymerase sigma-70 factor (ECF subfamily)
MIAARRAPMPTVTVSRAACRRGAAPGGVDADVGVHGRERALPALHASGPHARFSRAAPRSAAVHTRRRTPRPLPLRPPPRSVTEPTPGDVTSPDRATPVDPAARQREFESVALKWLPDVARFARSLTRDASAADDLVQETFLRAWRHWDTFRTGSEARAWLFTIARNAWHRAGPKAARYVPVEDDALEALAGDDVPMAAPPAMKHVLARADIAPAIREAIDALPAPFRDVVELVDLQELTYGEAATVLSIPIGTVRSRLFRARRLLQEALVEHARDLGLVPATDPEADEEA